MLHRIWFCCAVYHIQHLLARHCVGDGGLARTRGGGTNFRVGGTGTI